MSKNAIYGLLMSAAVVLATIYAYNRFSKTGGVAELGKKTAANG